MYRASKHFRGIKGVMADKSESNGDRNSGKSDDIQMPSIGRDAAGAVAGAVVGSVAGPIGTVVGGVVGALAAGAAGRRNAGVSPVWKALKKTAAKTSSSLKKSPGQGRSVAQLSTRKSSKSFATKSKSKGTAARKGASEKKRSAAKSSSPASSRKGGGKSPAKSRKAAARKKGRR